MIERKKIFAIRKRKMFRCNQKYSSIKNYGKENNSLSEGIIPGNLPLQ